MGRRLGAEMLVVAPVKYRPPRDELVAARVSSMERVVSWTAERLVDQGVDAAGTVLVAPGGLGSAAVDDFADQHEADLVAVASRRGSWLGLFPGSGMAHHLMREGRRPVLVIPDHRPGLGAAIGSWLQGQDR